MHANRGSYDLLRDFGISENFSCFPAFLIHILDCSLSAGFFPSGIMRERGGRNFFFFDQFFRGVFRRKRRGNWFLCARGKLLWKFLDKTLGWPRACFAESADRTPRDVVANGLERFRIFHNSAATQHAVGDFLHPKRTLPTGCALATAFVRVELVDVVQHPNHAARSEER